MPKDNFRRNALALPFFPSVNWKADGRKRIDCSTLHPFMMGVLNVGPLAFVPIVYLILPMGCDP